MNGAGPLQDFVNSTGKFNPVVVQTLKPVTPDGVLLRFNGSFEPALDSLLHLAGHSH